MPDLRFVLKVSFLRVGTTVTSYINCSKMTLSIGEVGHQWGLSSSVSGQGGPVTLQSDPHGRGQNP